MATSYGICCIIGEQLSCQLHLLSTCEFFILINRLLYLNIRTDIPAPFTEMCSELNLYVIDISDSFVYFNKSDMVRVVIKSLLYTSPVSK